MHDVLGLMEDSEARVTEWQLHAQSPSSVTTARILTQFQNISRLVLGGPLGLHLVLAAFPRANHVGHILHEDVLWQAKQLQPLS